MCHVVISERSRGRRDFCMCSHGALEEVDRLTSLGHLPASSKDACCMSKPTPPAASWIGPLDAQAGSHAQVQEDRNSQTILWSL